jgi:hypothetical protein
VRSTTSRSATAWPTALKSDVSALTTVVARDHI